MTERELLWRGPLFLYSPHEGGGGFVPPLAFESAVGDGGAGDETDEGDGGEGGDDENATALAAEEARQAQEEEDRINRLIDARQEKIREQVAARLSEERPPVVQTDHQAEMRKRFEAIADEQDPVKQEEMRVALAEERVRASLGSEIAYSAQKGAATTVRSLVKDIPEQADAYIDRAIQEQGLSPAQAANPANAKAIVDLAVGIAYREGAFKPAEKEPERTTIPKAAPTGGATPRGGIMERLTPDDRKLLELNRNQLGDYGKDDKGAWLPIEQCFNAAEIAEILANEGARR